mgnify:CR=1 FL=1
MLRQIPWQFYFWKGQLAWRRKECKACNLAGSLELHLEAGSHANCKRLSFYHAWRRYSKRAWHPSTIQLFLCLRDQKHWRLVSFSSRTWSPPQCRGLLDAVQWRCWSRRGSLQLGIPRWQREWTYHAFSSTQTKSNSFRGHVKSPNGI